MISSSSKLIRSIQQMPDTPGIYRMLNNNGGVLYIGKAKSLKKRTKTYLHTDKLPQRLQRMMFLTCAIEYTPTATECDALLLEARMIKKHQPPYNVLLKDDKSFAFILITAHPYPRAMKYRGHRKEKGHYIGPFTSNQIINEMLMLLHEAFQLRSCSDYEFKQRTRPCLRYHLKQCSAPCTHKITQEAYKQQADKALAFIRSARYVSDLKKKMAGHAQEQEYEKAKIYRDRLNVLRQLQPRLIKNFDGDIIALVQHQGATCIHVRFIRGGFHYGSENFFPQHDPDEPLQQILAHFFSQFYLPFYNKNNDIPHKLLVSHIPFKVHLIRKVLKEHSQYAVTLHVPRQGHAQKWLQQAQDNAYEALKARR